MQSTSGTLRAALDARVRRLRGRLLVDWDKNGFGATIDDLSDAFDEIVIERELTAERPGDVKLVAGYVAAQLTAKLANTGRTSTGTRTNPRITPRAYFSPYRSDSPLFGKETVSRPTTVDVQTLTTAGLEALPLFTGKTIELDSDDLSLTAADGWASTDAQIQMPLVISDDQTFSATAIKPGLWADWIVDTIFRKLGYYSSPPKRASSQFSATFHGSAAPEVGVMRGIFGENYSTLAFSPEADPGSPFTHLAKFHRAIRTEGVSGQVLTYELAAGGGPGPNNGQSLAYEGWHRLLSTSREQPLFEVYTQGGATPFVSAYYDFDTGKLQVTFNRGGADTNHATGLAGPTISPGTSWHYYYFFVSFTSTGANITMRYDGTTYGPFNVSTGSFTGSPNFNRIGVARGRVDAYATDYLFGLTEAVQLTSETSAGPYNDAFVPTAILESSWNRLDATPAAERIGAGGLLAQIADAEMAQIGFTESGIAYFVNRDAWTKAPRTTSQKTLTAYRDVERLPVRRGIEQVRNKVTARVISPDLQLNKDVWVLPKLKGLGVGASVTWLVTTKNPVTNLDTSVTSTTTAGNSRYQANRNRDGSGSVVTDLTFSVQQIDVNTIKITVSNPGAAPAWLVNTSGKPYLKLVGDQVVFGNDNTTSSSHFKVESADTAATAISVAKHGGERLLELNANEDNPFFQDDESAQELVDALAVELVDPKPVIEEFVIRGDPSLQLGDRVTAVDPETGINADFFLTKKRDTLDAQGGFKQTIDGRGA